MSTLNDRPLVYLVDDEPLIRKGLAQAFDLAGFEVRAFEDAEQLLEDNQSRTGPHQATVLVSDVRLPGMDGLGLMQHWHTQHLAAPTILITGHGDIQLAVQAMRQGAFDFIEKPFKPETVIDSVRRALEVPTLVESSEQSASGDTAADGHAAALRRLNDMMLGQSQAMQRLKQQTLKFASVKADVLILGETGTGKEKLARALHDFGSRCEQNFVAINCGALPANTIESELFGHEAGAFTDARTRRIGKFEFAQGGTVFLDEIESMPLSIQTELLRVLQERRICRMGSNSEVSIDVRVVAATKVNLLEAASQGSFREDLYYRLNVLTLELPPLRDRPEDIPSLFQHFVERTALAHGVSPPPVAVSLLASLQQHQWPGNVRELENAAVRYVLAGSTEAHHELDAVAQNTSDRDQATLAELVGQYEAAVIQSTYRRYDGDLKRTWEALGISRRTLYDKMARYGLKRSD